MIADVHQRWAAEHGAADLLCRRLRAGRDTLLGRLVHVAEAAGSRIDHDSASLYLSSFSQNSIARLIRRSMSLKVQEKQCSPSGFMLPTVLHSEKEKTSMNFCRPLSTQISWRHLLARASLCVVNSWLIT